jgi:cytoskeletal protein CcmA (bactofilin family)
MAGRSDFSINTIVGRGSTLNGNVTSGGFTRIDGNVRGTVQAQGRVIVSQSGRLNTQRSTGVGISGTVVTVGGVVSGNVLASEKVFILANAIILGDVITRRVQADEGCVIHGRVKVCTSAETWEAEAKLYEDTAAVSAAIS